MADAPVPLPEVEPTTRAIVVATYKIKNPTAEDLSRIDNIVDAVCAYVRGLPVADKARGLNVWPANIVEGSTMLAGRIWRRKDSPGGTYTVGGDVPIFVHRQDPDVALLLGLGTYAKPSAG